MNNTILLFLKSFLVGVGKIIPGLSGAMIAMSLGIYEKGLDAICCIRKNIKFLIICGLGILIAVFLLGNLIKYLIENYYLVTMLLFSGMILGGISWQKKQNLTRKDLIIILLFLLTLIIFLKYKNSFVNFEINKINIITIANLIFAGFIDAFSTIIPGISGTALLIMFGYYEIIINTFSNIFCLQNMFILFFFLLGFITGIFLVTKLVKIMLKKCRKEFYLIVNMLAIFSFLNIIIKTLYKNYNYYEIVIGLIMLLIGYKFTKKMIKN